MKRQSGLSSLRDIACSLRIVGVLGALGIWLSGAAVARAQFRPIPNYVGIGAGALFRNDINNHLSGGAAVAPRIVSLPLGQLPTEQDGQEYWCSDCKQTNPCAGSGAGALALGSGGQWSCTSGASLPNGFPLSSDVSAAAHRIQSLAPNLVTGDALSQGQSHLNDLTTPTANYSMGAKRLQNLGAGATAGDALSYGQSGASLNGLNLNSNTLSGLPPATASGQAISFGQSGAQLTATMPGGTTVSHSVAAANNETSQVIPAPATITNGNVLLLVAGWNSTAISGNTPGTITPPAGFTQLRYDTLSASDQVSSGIYCKVASSESGSYTISWQNAQNFAGGIVNVSGLTGCTADAASGGVATTNGATATAPALTLTGTNDFIIGLASSDYTTGLVGSPGSQIFNEAGSYEVVSPYSRTVLTSPSSPFNATSGGHQIAQQVALFSSVTQTGAPVVQGATAQLKTLTNTSVNNVLNVMAAPYNAQNDGATDDTAAIQQAIYDAEGATPPTFPAGITGKTVYLPASTAGACYMTSKPLRVASGPIEIKGDAGTCFTKSYAGPTFITENWGTSYLHQGPALIGTGASIDTTGCTSSCTNGIIDLAMFLNTSQTNLASQFANGFDIEWWMEPKTLASQYVLESIPSSPGSGNGMFAVSQSAAGATSATINTTGGLVSLSACPNQSINTAYDVAIDWDKTTYRLFQGGTLCSSVASSNAPVLGPFEGMLLPDLGNRTNWIAGGTQHSAWLGYLDDIRFEYASEHTANYTPPTARFVADGNTAMLIDPSVTNVDGTQQVTVSSGGGTTEPVYLPVLSGAQAGLNGLHLHNMDLCKGKTSYHYSDGLFAQWSNNAEIDHVTCSNATFAGLDFYNNDYGTYEHDNVSLYGMVGIVHGVAWNGSLAQDDRMDNQTVTCEETVGDGGGGFHDIHEGCTNRGNLYYCKMYMTEAFSSLVDFDGCDQEAGDTSFVASILDSGSSIPIQFSSPDLSGVSGHPFMEVDGAAAGPTIINGQFQQGTGATAIINYGSAPATPAVLVNPQLAAGVALSNMPQWVDVLGASNDVISGNLSILQVPKFNAGLNHLIVNPITDPAAATISVVGATASGVFGPYFVVCHDSNGGVSNPSPASNTIANGPSSLSSSNYINIAWIAVSGCATWDVLKNNTSTSLALGVTGTSYRDIGGSTAAYSAPVRNTSGDVSGLAQISVGTSFAKLPGTVVNGMRLYCTNCDPPANPPVACTSSGSRTGAFADGVNNQWLCAP